MLEILSYGKTSLVVAYKYGALLREKIIRGFFFPYLNALEISLAV